MRKIRTTLFYFFFYSWTIIFFIVFSPVKFFTRNFAVFLSKIWTSSIMALSKKILGIDCIIHGEKNILNNKPILIASNHQAAWETFFLTYFFNDPVFILKKELKMIPILKWYFEKLDFIFIDRNKGFNSLKHTINSINNLVNKGRKIFIIFPEGTRLKPNEQGSLNPGVFAIHKILKMIVIPIKHDSGKYWINGKILKKPGKIKIEIFPPIKSLDKKKFLEKLRKIYY